MFGVLDRHSSKSGKALFYLPVILLTELHHGRTKLRTIERISLRAALRVWAARDDAAACQS